MPASDRVLRRPARLVESLDVTVPDETARLRLRRFGPDDTPLVAALLGDPEVMRFLEGDPLPADDVAARVVPEILDRYRLLPGYGRFAVERRADGGFVGWVSVRPVVPDDGPMVRWPTGPVGAPVVEIGYRLRSSAWGQGYATEAARAAVDHAVALGAREVVATTMSVNIGSRRVLDKLGFRQTATVHLEWENPNPGVEEGEAEYRLRTVDRTG